MWWSVGVVVVKSSPPLSKNRRFKRLNAPHQYLFTLRLHCDALSLPPLLRRYCTTYSLLSDGRLVCCRPVICAGLSPQSAKWMSVLSRYLPQSAANNNNNNQVETQAASQIIDVLYSNDFQPFTPRGPLFVGRLSPRTAI